MLWVLRCDLLLCYHLRGIRRQWCLSLMGWSWSLYFANKFWFTLRFAGIRELAALHDRRAALPLVSCSLHHAVYVDRFSVKLTKHFETARSAGLSVFPVTKASSRDEFSGRSCDRVYGRVSVTSRRIWMIKLGETSVLRIFVAAFMSFDAFKRARPD